MSKGIYKITNTLNGVFYIGSSKELERRMQQHKSDLKNNRHANCKLQNSFNKYGVDNFTFEIIEYCYCNENILREIEQEYIEKTKSYKRGIGFNLAKQTKGGGAIGERNYWYGKGHLLNGENNPFYGKKHTDETKQILSEKNSGLNSHWFGRQHKEETKKKISEAHKGKEFSKEHRENLSISIKKAYEVGKIKSRGFTKKDREKQKEKCSIKVVMLDMQSNYLKKFDSVTEAGIHIGVNPENITRVCKGRNMTSGGYKWMYLNEYNLVRRVNNGVI